MCALDIYYHMYGHVCVYVCVTNVVTTLVWLSLWPSKTTWMTKMVEVHGGCNCCCDWVQHNVPCIVVYNNAFCNLSKTIRHCNVVYDIYNLKLVINLVVNMWIPYNDIFKKNCPWKNGNLGRGMSPENFVWACFHVPSSWQLGWKSCSGKLGNFVKCLSPQKSCKSMFSHSNLLAWGSGLRITFSFSSITK